MTTQAKSEFILSLDEIDNHDTGTVGGKNASLGEMIAALHDRGVRVPGGFATTAEAYWRFIEHNQLDESLHQNLDKFSGEKQSLEEIGSAIRDLFHNGEFPDEIATAIRDAYRELSQEYDTENVAVAVRSSATAEDLPEASFAGQQETFLNVEGESELMEACKKCYASLFTDRAIIYRNNNGFDHLKVALSIGVQRMVRSDLAGSGVMFSLDTETGFPDVVVINAAWGLGETVVKGTVNPDEYRIFKPLLKKENVIPIIEKKLGAKAIKMVYASEGDAKTQTVETDQQEQRNFVLSDDQILQLARWAVTIEDHYGRPMDMEWAIDGQSDGMTIVQARPETVQSQKVDSPLKSYRLNEHSEALVKGLSVGQAIATGKVFVLGSPDEGDRFEEGGVLVTDSTDPDWGPLMKRAAAIVTNHGGRTSHAAIVSRELGLAAIVGAGDATEMLSDGQEVTVSCAEGAEGTVYEVLAENDLRRGENGLQVYMMCEIPSNIFLAEQFAERYDGFSIGSNDLTQLIMGVDRDSSRLKQLFDERNEAVKNAIRDVIERAHAHDTKVGICGQAPSDYPEFVEFLVECGIDSMSLNPDSVVEVITSVRSRSSGPDAHDDAHVCV